jgi:hypothetical protein
LEVVLERGIKIRRLELATKHDHQKTIDVFSPGSLCQLFEPPYIRDVEILEEGTSESRGWRREVIPG